MIFSTSGECDEVEMGSRLTLRERDWNTSMTRCTSSTGPDTTVLVVPFIAAMAVRAVCTSRRHSATSASEASSETMAPLVASRCNSCPRRATKGITSSIVSTPAKQAAAYSPRECPMTAVGRNPQSHHRCAVASSSATMAG